MSQIQATVDLFEIEDVVFRRYLPDVRRLEDGTRKINEWDIPHTISALSYLVHSDYRYYGKFPSVVAGQILEQLPPPSPEHYVLDNFCGSGTTLVEAKLRDIRSYGIDISWLSMLASNVKTNHLDLSKVRSELNQIVMWFEKNTGSIEKPNDSFVDKWFSERAARDLVTIQYYLKNMTPSGVRDFFVIAFIGIVRRVSKAYDGEVRPHINKDKKQRDVISAFSKKVNDMLKDHLEFQELTKPSVEAECFLGNNLELPERFNDGKCYLVVSHPPYLNSFNYAPVFSLEFYWGKAFEGEYTDGVSGLYKAEMKAHPANEKITEGYFNHLKKCYEESFRIQSSGGYLAIVIGDCTRNKKLIPVVDRTIEIVESIGYKLIELNYRTTHYGLGKYAYSHRADYHGDKVEKKDGIIIFKK